MKISTDKYGYLELKEVFIPVSFVTEKGEVLSVVMRDSGFEIWYKEKYVDLYERIELKEGNIKKVE